MQWRFLCWPLNESNSNYLRCICDMFSPHVCVLFLNSLFIKRDTASCLSLFCRSAAKCSPSFKNFQLRFWGLWSTSLEYHTCTENSSFIHSFCLFDILPKGYCHWNPNSPAAKKKVVHKPSRNLSSVQWPFPFPVQLWNAYITACWTLEQYWLLLTSTLKSFHTV